MKKFIPFILIAAFLFPTLGNAATAPTATPVAPIVAGTVDINTQFHTILNTLTDLAKRTQAAIDQLSLNGIDTTQAQTALDTANASFAKAKITLNTPKYPVKVEQSQIQDGKTNILLSLSLLKASLPTLDQTGQ